MVNPGGTHTSVQVPVTRKPEGIRMGKGKGAIAFYATPVRRERSRVG